MKKRKSSGDKIREFRSQLDKQSGSRRGDASSALRPESAARLPRPLIGKLAQTSDSIPKRLCFAYNMRCGCSGARDGKKCSKGLHLCMEPPGPCAKLHPCLEH